VPHWVQIWSLLIAWLVIAVVGGLFVLFALLATPSQPRRLTPQRQRLCAWTGALVAVAAVAFYLIPPVLAAPSQIAAADGVTKVRVSAIVGLASLPLQIAVWLLLARACGQRPAFGIAPRRGVAEALVGYLTWLLISPVVYVVSEVTIVVYLLLKQAPTSHPIIQTLQTAPLSFGLMALLFVDAVVAAPIREELFFRGILQPFFANRPWGGDMALWLAAAVGLVVHPAGPLRLAEPLTILNAAAPVLLVVGAFAFYRVEGSRWETRWFAIHDPAARGRALRAIVGTSALFANLHANVWPTPIPLFVLSLGLGWVAFRTQSVVAPVVVHVLFNAIVFATLGLSATRG
jgi:membrane protease YdiL (CAAX protease family)